MASEIPRNVAKFTVEDVLAATGGEAVQRASTASSAGVCTDSRAVAPGNVFVALRGERFDGHEHVEAAVKAGATMVVASREVDPSALAGRASLVRVPDTLQALGALGRAHRRRWSRAGRDKLVVAITGSAGKTTTRQTVAAMLSGLGYRVHASSGNLNNAVGIPHVLLGLGPEHDAAVIEVGTSSRGEIAHGASLVEHDVAVLTLVAAAHTEGIGTVDDVAHEKGALLSALKPSGAAVVNGENVHCDAQLIRAVCRRHVRYGAVDGADVRIVGERIEGGARTHVALSVGRRELSLTTPGLGHVGALAVAAAAGVAVAIGREDLNIEAVSDALARLENVAGRLTKLVLPNGTIVLDDSYNANRASMVAGLEVAAQIARAEGRRLVTVLGEMRELGALSAPEHRAVGEAVASAKPAVLIAVAGDASHIADVARRAVASALFVPDAQSAAEELAPLLAPGDVVLVKGSRGVGLERVVRAITQPQSPPASS